MVISDFISRHLQIKHGGFVYDLVLEFVHNGNYKLELNNKQTYDY